MSRNFVLLDAIKTEFPYGLFMLDKRCAYDLDRKFEKGKNTEYVTLHGNI